MTADFRYHVASLAAVFLALGIGILIGTGFVGTTVVRQQTATMNRLSANYAELRKETHEREQTERTLMEAVPHLVKNLLQNQRVLVVQTETGREAAEQATKALELAGATVERESLLGEDTSKLLKRGNLPAFVVLAGGEDEEQTLARDLPLIQALHQEGIRIVAVELYENKVSLVSLWSKEADATVDCINRATGWLALPLALRGENGTFGLKQDARTPPVENLTTTLSAATPTP